LCPLAVLVEDILLTDSRIESFGVENFEEENKLVLSCKCPFIFFVEEVIKLLSIDFLALFLEDVGSGGVANNSTKVRS
jgi:hypothetical protein